MIDILGRDEAVLFISFDETRRNFERRAAGVGLDVRGYLASGKLNFAVIDPANISHGELTGAIRHAVAGGTTAIVLDSLSGYQHAMPDETHLLLQLHQLATYLNQLNVLTILTIAQPNIVAASQASVDLTYLADTVFLVRFFEAAGMTRRAISVIKKRTGRHERTIRELAFDRSGVHVGEVLKGFSGMLSEVPIYTGTAELFGEIAK